MGVRAGQDETCAWCAFVHSLLDLLAVVAGQSDEVQRSQEIEKRVNERAPGTRLILASTHTHHGPDTIGMWGRNVISSGVDREYLGNLKDKAVGTVLEALGRPQPALLHCSSVHVPGVARNARDPETVDDELTCLQFCHREGGDSLATMLIFPCHPEVLWDHNPHVTSDYPGFLRQQVETETGAPCLFFAGALGGMMTPDVQEHSFAEADQMGKTLARAALDALSQADAMEVTKLEHATQTGGCGFWAGFGTRFRHGIEKNSPSKPGYGSIASRLQICSVASR